MTDRVTLYDEQGTKLVLGAAEHLATGGEGSVYARNDKVYKVYLDPAKAQRAKLEEKVALLRQLQHPGIAAPTGVLRDKNGSFLGIELIRQPGEALCRLFTNTWRDANQFGYDETQKVALAMRDIMGYAHAHNALLVDGNELNWLVHGCHPVAIDTDSWALPGFPATAIMASIRDPQLKPNSKGVLGFSEGSDWFSWAVVTFQLWTGIHPFKGTHPNFARNAMAERMLAGASVFDQGVTLPGAARPFTDIPLTLRNWYEDVFARGARTAPPANWQSHSPQVAPKLRITTLLNASLKQERLGHAGEKVLAAFSGFVVARRADGSVTLWDALRKAAQGWVSSADLKAVVQQQAALLRLPSTEVLLTVVPDQGVRVVSKDNPTAPNYLPSRASRLWQTATRVFALVEGVSNGLVELRAAIVGDRALVGVDKQWPVNVLSTEFFRGCFVQDCLGVPFLGALEGEGLIQLRAPALKGMRVVQGLAFDRHNVWLTAIRKQDGELVRIRMAATGDCYEVQEETVVADADLDGALLGTGVGVVRLGTQLRISKGTYSKALDPCGLSAQARLLTLGQGLGLVEDGDVSKLSLS